LIIVLNNLDRKVSLKINNYFSRDCGSIALVPTLSLSWKYVFYMFLSLSGIIGKDFYEKIKTLEKLTLSNVNLYWNIETIFFEVNF